MGNPGFLRLLSLFLWSLSLPPRPSLPSISLHSNFRISTLSVPTRLPFFREISDATRHDLPVVSEKWQTLRVSPDKGLLPLVAAGRAIDHMWGVYENRGPPISSPT